jgi:hypothetical protein
VLPGTLRGFVNRASFGDQAFDLAPLFLRVCLSLGDFAGQKENALISHLKDDWNCQ